MGRLHDKTRLCFRFDRVDDDDDCYDSDRGFAANVVRTAISISRLTRRFITLSDPPPSRRWLVWSTDDHVSRRGELCGAE